MESKVSSTRILVLAQLSTATKNVLWRAGLIAREHGALLHVLQVVRDPREVAPARGELERLCEPLRHRLGVTPQIEVVRGDLQREVTRAAREAALLVLAAWPGDTLRGRIAAAPLQRVVRLSAIPALVIKRHAAPHPQAHGGDAGLRGRYGRVLVSVDLAREASDLIAAASRLSKDRAMEVFHAVSARRNPAPVSRGQGTRFDHGTAMERARASLQALIAGSHAHCSGATVSVGFGAAAPSVLSRQRAVGAELLVVGTRQRGLLAQYFVGRTTQQILAESRADVLVVPPRVPQAATPGPAAHAATDAPDRVSGDSAT